MIASATLGPSVSTPIAGLATGGGNLPTLDAKVSQGVTEGKLIRKVEPNYPMQARAQHIAGTVALEITIAEDGTVRNIKEISGSQVLAAAARSALQGWRYSPFLLNGQPVAIQKPFIFRLP